MTSEETPEPAALDLSQIDLSQAVVCYSKCWPCQFAEHFDPPETHTWMDEDDAAHAGYPWPLPPEIADTKVCGCSCTRSPR